MRLMYSEVSETVSCRHAVSIQGAEPRYAVFSRATSRAPRPRGAPSWASQGAHVCRGPSEKQVKCTHVP